MDQDLVFKGTYVAEINDVSTCNSGLRHSFDEIKKYSDPLGTSGYKLTIENFDILLGKNGSNYLPPPQFCRASYLQLVENFRVHNPVQLVPTSGKN